MSIPGYLIKFLPLLAAKEIHVAYLPVLVKVIQIGSHLLLNNRRCNKLSVKTR